jgi:hypothetical protein
MSSKTPTPAPTPPSSHAARSVAIALGLFVATVVVAAVATYVALPAGGHTTVQSSPPPQVQSRCLKNGQPCAADSASPVGAIAGGSIARAG